MYVCGLHSVEILKKNGKTNLKEYICMTKKDGYIDVRTLIKEGRELTRALATQKIPTPKTSLPHPFLNTSTPHTQQNTFFKKNTKNS